MPTFDEEQTKEKRRARYFLTVKRGKELLAQIDGFEKDLQGLRSEITDVDKIAEIDSQRASFISSLRSIFGL